MQTIQERIQAIHEEFEDIRLVLDARRIRAWCAARVRAYNRQYGHSGVTIVHKATGVSRPRIMTGIQELEEGVPLPVGRIRRSGGGRKKNY